MKRQILLLPIAKRKPYVTQVKLWGGGVVGGRGWPSHPFKIEEWITLLQESFTGEVKFSDQSFKDKQESDIGREERSLSPAGEWERQALMQALGAAQALDRLVGGRPEDAEGRALKAKIWDILKMQKKATLDFGLFCFCPSLPINTDSIHVIKVALCLWISSLQYTIPI